MFAGLRTPWSRGRRLTAVIGGLVLAAGSAVGVGVAAQLGDAHAATDADSPQMASVLSQLAANATATAGKVGPFAKDFIDITKVAPDRATARPTRSWFAPGCAHASSTSSKRFRQASAPS